MRKHGVGFGCEIGVATSAPSARASDSRGHGVEVLAGATRETSFHRIPPDPV